MKYNLTFRQLVDKMLEPHGVNYDYVVKNPMIDGKHWYDHYTWTKDEQNEFIRWAVDLVRAKHYWNRDLAESEVAWFILSFGLRVEHIT